MLMLSTTSAFAEVTAEQNATDTSVMISGSFPGHTPYEDVTLSVYPWDDAADNIDTSSTQVAMGQATVQEDGSFTGTVTMDRAEPYGWYGVLVVPYDDMDAQVAKFYYASSDVKFEMLQRIINETDSTNQKANLEEAKYILGFDMDRWDNLATVTDMDLQLDAAEAIISNLAQWRGTDFTIDILPDVVVEINRELYTQALNGSLVSDLEELKNYADVEEYYNELTAGNMSDAAAQEVIDSMFGAGFENAADMEESFKESIILAGVTSPKDDNTMNAKYFIDTFGSDIGLTSMSKYTGLTSNQKVNVITSVRNSDPSTFEQLDAAFTSAVNQYGGGTTGPIGPTNPSNPSNPSDPDDDGTIIVTPPETAEPTPNNPDYNDIDDIVWAQEAIKELSSRRIFEGYDDGSFGPNNPILREEFIKITVVGLYGADAIDMSASPSFTDAQNAWYSPYIASAETNGITQGIGDGLFGIGDQITRQDMALMLYRMIRAAGLDTSTDEYDFTDKDQIADYARDAVFALKNMGIINGYDDGSFQPEGNTTRAEAAVLLYNTLDKLGKLIR